MFYYLKLFIYIPTILTLVFLSFYVLMTRRHDLSSKLFFLSNFSILVWLVSLFIADLGINYQLSYFFTQIGLLGAIWFPLFFVFFLYNYPFIKETLFFNKFIKIILIIIAFLFSIISFTKLNIESLIIHDWGVEVIPGILYPIIYAYFFTLIILGIYLVYKKYKFANNIQRKQLKFVLLGVVITSIITLTTNIIFVSFGYSELGLIGVPAILIFVLSIFYSITKHHLFNLKLITNEILVYVLMVLVFTSLFSYASVIELIFKLVIFILFLFLSILLIKKIISKEVKQKEQVIVLANELKSANEELKIKNKNLKSLLNMKTEFLHIASHQIKTPISIIKGYLSMVLDGTYKNDESRFSAIQKALFNLERLNDTAKNFLDASDLEGGSIDLRTGAVDIWQEIKSIIDIKELVPENKNIKIKLIEPKSKIPLVLTSEDKIKDVFSNLIDNAIYYSKDGTVTIDFKINENYIVVRVADQGIGIEKEEAKKLFVKFSRGNRAKLLRPDGSGLGLFIIKQILDNTGGKIWLESEGHDKGTTFFVQLPIFKK